MAIRISTTHIWSKLFVPVVWISRLVAIGVVFSLLEAILPDNGLAGVVFIAAFFAVIIAHAMTVEQWYHAVQTYLYIRISLGTPISLNEAKHFLLLFAPTDEGVWYPMTGIRDLPRTYRRQVLLESARAIYAERGYQFGLVDGADDESADKDGTACNIPLSGQDTAHLPSGFRYLVGMLCRLAKSDGVITKHEVAIIDDCFLNVLELSAEARNAAIRMFEESKKGDTPFEVYAREFYACHKDNRDLLESAVSLLASVAYADGELSAEEEVLLNEAIAIFRVDAAEYHQYRSEHEQRKPTVTNDESEIRYARILGLHDAITPDTVKAAYRKLAVQYHPDKVSHLGSKIREVAETEMKKINEAYEYFQKKYAL